MHRITTEEARQMLQAQMPQTDEMVLPMTFRPAIELAICSHDQLRYAVGMGGGTPLSFDQTAVEATARMHGITVTPRVAKDLAVLQAEGLRLLKEAS